MFFACCASVCDDNPLATHVHTGIDEMHIQVGQPALPASASGRAIEVPQERLLQLVRNFSQKVVPIGVNVRAVSPTFLGGEEYAILHMDIDLRILQLCPRVRNRQDPMADPLYTLHLKDVQRLFVDALSNSPSIVLSQENTPNLQLVFTSLAERDEAFVSIKVLHAVANALGANGLGLAKITDSPGLEQWSTSVPDSLSAEMSAVPESTSDDAPRLTSPQSLSTPDASPSPDETFFVASPSSSAPTPEEPISPDGSAQRSEDVVAPPPAEHSEQNELPPPAQPSEIHGPETPQSVDISELETPLLPPVEGFEPDGPPPAPGEPSRPGSPKRNKHVL